jgi:hypothetical protein
MRFQNADGSFVEYRLALALSTVPENSGTGDTVSKFVNVRKTPAAVALLVVSVGNIVHCVHVIPGMASISKTGDRRNERWIVNSYINLGNWNDVYN